MTRTSLAAFAALSPFLTSSRAEASDDAPPVGTTMTLPVVSASVSAGGIGRESRRIVYAPPPGWYVRSHRVEITRKIGAVTYSVGTVPAGWAWRSEEQTAASGRSSGSVSVSAYKASSGGQGEVVQAAATSGLHTTASSHHLLVVDVAARGPGLWRGESEVGLTVMAELVYLGR